MAYGGLIQISYQDVLGWGEEEIDWYTNRLIKEKEREDDAMNKK